MIKKILLSIALPVLTLMAITGCGHSNTGANATTDMTNATPATMSTNTTNMVPALTNMPPTNSTDMVNTNLSTNGMVTNTNNP